MRRLDFSGAHGRACGPLFQVLRVGNPDDTTEMGGVFDFIQQEVGDVGAADGGCPSAGSGWQVIVGDAVALPAAAVGEARRTRDRPIEAAGGDDTLHLGVVGGDVAQKRVAEKAGEEAAFRKEHSDADYQQTTEPCGFHGGEGGASAVAYDGVLGGSGGSEGGEYRVVAVKRGGHRVGIKNVALDDGQARTGLAELLRRANKGSDAMAALEGLLDEFSADAARGAEDEKTKWFLRRCAHDALLRNAASPIRRIKMARAPRAYCRAAGAL